MTNLTSTVTSISTSVDSEASANQLPSSIVIPNLLPVPPVTPVRADSDTVLPCFVLTCGDTGDIINVPMNQTQARCLGMETPALIGQPQVQTVQIFQNASQTPTPSNQNVILKPPTAIAPVALPFKDPRDVAIGESLLKLIRPHNSSTNLPNTPARNAMSFAKTANITNIRLIPMQIPLNVAAQRPPPQMYPQMMNVVQPPRQQANEALRPPLTIVQRINVPLYRPTKPLAKTITTPSYSYANMPRMCPAKVASPTIRPSIMTYSGLHRQQFSSYVVKSNVQIPPQPQPQPQSQPLPLQHYLINQTKTAELNSSLEARCQLPQLRHLLMSPFPNIVVTSGKEMPEDPIGLLVPEVEIVEDESQQVTIPQWSPESKIKRKLDGDIGENAKKKCKVDDKIEMKKAKLVLDKLDVTVIKKGQVDLKKISNDKLFLPRPKIIPKKATVAVSENDGLKKVVETEKAEPKMRCLVYKSSNFTHVIPLQDVISIPNELLEDLETSSPVTPCQQLENLLGLVSVASTDDVEPEFEAMDLNTVSSESLSSKLLETLAKRYKANDSAKVKLNKLRDKLMTALATTKKKL